MMTQEQEGDDLGEEGNDPGGGAAFPVGYRRKNLVKGEG